MWMGSFIGSWKWYTCFHLQEKNLYKWGKKQINKCQKKNMFNIKVDDTAATIQASYTDWDEQSRSTLQVFSQFQNIFVQQISQRFI